MAALAYALFGGLLMSYGLRPWHASCAAYAVVIPFAYLMQKTFTFKSELQHRTAFPRYLITQIFAFVLSACLSEALFESKNINIYLGFALVAVIVAISNYFSLKLWTFRRS